jgi:hypothetical protein
MRAASVGTFYEAGGDYALFGLSAGVFDADFSREAADILDAIVSAIDVIETVGTGRSRLWRWVAVVAWFHEYERDRWDEETTR